MRTEVDSATPQAAKQLRTMRILWGAITTSLLIYLGVTRTIPAQTAAMGNIVDLMVLMLAILSTVVSGIIVALPRLPLGKMPPFQLAILRWALAESIGIFGVVVHFLGASPTVTLSFLAWSFLLLIALFPKQKHLE